MLLAALIVVENIWLEEKAELHSAVVELVVL